MNDSTGLIERKRNAISLLRKHRGVLVALSGGLSAWLSAYLSEATMCLKMLFGDASLPVCEISSGCKST